MSTSCMATLMELFWKSILLLVVLPEIRARNMLKSRRCPFKTMRTSWNPRQGVVTAVSEKPDPTLCKQACNIAARLS